MHRESWGMGSARLAEGNIGNGLRLTPVGMGSKESTRLSDVGLNGENGMLDGNLMNNNA
tara:strand:+ start:559 stop:735 length:177 start_codon:yes stop_codon:yes gene_type:complete